MVEEESNHVLCSSKEKAIAAMPALMDKCSDSEDWKNGLKGFGSEDEDNYLAFVYSGDSVGDTGVLLSNCDGDSDESESIYLSQMEVDPPVTRY